MADDEDDLAIAADVRSHENNKTTKAAIEALAKERELAEANVEEPEIAEAQLFVDKTAAACKLHNEKVCHPNLDFLIFNIAFRFPHSVIMLAFDKIFNPDHWPGTWNLFTKRDCKKEIQALSEHYAQESHATGFAAIDPDRIDGEWNSAQVWLWSEFTQLNSSQAAAPAAKLKPTTYTNPLLAASASKGKNLFEEVIGPSDPPLVAVSMLDVVRCFINNKHAKEQCPTFVLFAEIAVTIGITTASCERGFSLMKLIMTRLRSRLSQPMLDALMRINLMSGSMTDQDLFACVRAWYDKKSRRVAVSYHDD